MSTDGVRKIIEEIEKSAEKKVAEILSEAQKKVEAKLNATRTAAEEQDRTILSRGEQEARRESQRILAEARIKARREKAGGQEELVRKSFERAQETLKRIAEERNVDGTKYSEVLERLIIESVKASGAESLEVLLNPRDKALISQEILDGIAQAMDVEQATKIGLRISEEGLSSMGGVVVRSIDGKVRVDNTFESRIDRFRETVRTRVAKKLFGREL